QRHVQKVQDSARHMGELVDDLLRLAQVGRAVPALRCVRLDAMVADIVEELRPEYAGREIEWQLEPLPEVLCDRALIRQVFANLLSNAVKYTRPRERAVIRVGAQASDDGPVFFV